MIVTKKYFVDLHEKYNKVIKLINEDSKSDPANEPYLSKYSARQILMDMKASIESWRQTQKSDSLDYLKLNAMLGSVYLYLGMISLDTEEITTGRKHLEKCKEIIGNYYMKPEVILIATNMFNQFGIMCSQSEPEESKIYLEKAEALYKEFKLIPEEPIDISDLFEVNLETYNREVARTNLEKVYTFTLYYLAQVYGLLKDELKSSVYCHITLQRQLEMGEYDPIDWALNSATLSQFFMEKNGFKQARHHLAASSNILENYGRKLTETTETSETQDALIETFKHRSADVARCWSKYGILLLSKSRERLLSHTENIDEKCSISSDLSKLELSSNSTISVDDLQHLDFTGIDLSSQENQITDQYVLTLEDAKKVFLNSQKWLIEAQEYYRLDVLASDHIEIVLDQTQLYFNLLFFEDNPENQSKLHKRRVDLLENILANVNSKYYLQYCRQAWFELARTYADIVDIKKDKLRESKSRPSPLALTKINNLVEKGILHYNNFINSFRDNKNNAFPDKITADDEKPFLRAYFHVAALHGQYITLDKQAQLRNTEASFENYKLICDYCDKHPQAKDLLPMEFSICKEMIALLPIKIIKLKSQCEII